MRDVLGLELESRIQIDQCLSDGLPRQRVHQIDVDVVEARTSRFMKCIDDVIRAVNPAQAPKLFGIETLCAQ